MLFLCIVDRFVHLLQAKPLSAASSSAPTLHSSAPLLNQPTLSMPQQSEYQARSTSYTRPAPWAKQDDFQRAPRGHPHAPSNRTRGPGQGSTFYAPSDRSHAHPVADATQKLEFKEDFDFEKGNAQLETILSEMRLNPEKKDELPSADVCLLVTRCHFEFTNANFRAPRPKQLIPQMRSTIPAAASSTTFPVSPLSARAVSPVQGKCILLQMQCLYE